MADFLRAEWRHLLMLNWAVEPGLLADRVPQGVVQDTHEGQTWVSVVAFLFLKTRVKGIAVPFHIDFEELNLRYYVRRDVPDVDRGLPHRRGVAFVTEVVPRAAIAGVARLLYNEQYLAKPMRHQLMRGDQALPSDGVLQAGDRVSYGWKDQGEWGQVAALISGPAAPLVAGSHPHFIAEHYWGYARQHDGSTVEYEVRHPAWRVFPVDGVVFAGPIGALYGDRIAAELDRPPDSAFLAEGSEVSVGDGEPICSEFSV